MGECNFMVLTLEKGLRIRINNVCNLLDDGKFNEENKARAVGTESKRGLSSSSLQDCNTSCSLYL